MLADFQICFSVPLNRKLDDNAIQEIIWETKVEKLSKDLALKHKTPLQQFLRKLKEKKLF